MREAFLVISIQPSEGWVQAERWRTLGEDSVWGVLKIVIFVLNILVAALWGERIGLFEPSFIISLCLD
jgi:hypothetical protein